MLVFEMLAGYPPFYSEDRMEVIDMRTHFVRVCPSVRVCVCVCSSVYVRACVYSVCACVYIYCKYRSFLTKIRTIGA